MVARRFPNRCKRVSYRNIESNGIAAMVMPTVPVAGWDEGDLAGLLTALWQAPEPDPDPLLGHRPNTPDCAAGSYFQPSSGRLERVGETIAEEVWRDGGGEFGQPR
jgi:hypothetical protein